jgi:hypothetical protein
MCNFSIKKKSAIPWDNICSNICVSSAPLMLRSHLVMIPLSSVSLVVKHPDAARVGAAQMCV